MIVNLITTVYNFLWGDLFTIPLPGGGSLGISLLILLLIPTGIYFTIRTRFLPIRLFPDMIRALSEKKNEKSSLSSFQTLIVSTATRVGMGNLVGVVAAVSAGGAGAVFWMWVQFKNDSVAQTSARLPRLSKLRSHSFTKKKILCTAATAAVLPTTFTIWLKTTSRRKNDTFCRLFCLPLPV